MKYIPGSGNSTAKLLVVAEAPGREEDELGQPLVGPSGKLFNEMLESAGLSRSSVYCTNVVKVRPPNNDLKRLPEIGCTIDQFIPQLWDEIKAIKPNCILALGNLALKTLTGKTGIVAHRGSILPTINGDYKVVSTIHPAALLHISGNDNGVFKYSAKYYMQEDFNRAVAESEYKEMRLPSRLLEVCHSSVQLYRFIEQYQSKEFCAVDIETFKAIPICVGLSFVPHHALSVPMFNLMAWEGSTQGIAQNELTNIWMELYKFFKTTKAKLIGQNFKFDQQLLESVAGFKMPPLHADLMMMAHSIHSEFPKSLAFLTSVYTREPYYKDEYKDFNPSKDKIEKIFLYNAKDAAVSRELYDTLLARLYEVERKIEWPNWVQEFFFDYVMQLHELYMDIEAEGIAYDFQKRDELWDKYENLISASQEKLAKAAEADINANSPKQVGELLYNKLGLPYRNSTDEDTLVALLANHAKRDEQVQAIECILDIRRYRKTLTTYISADPDFDGRMRTSYRLAGTETGRTSTGKLDPPMRPYKGIGLGFQTLTKHGDIGSEIRELLIPDPGCVIVELDLSQAEARIVAHLANDEETLKLFDTTDIHKLTASWAFSMPIDMITGEQRFVGKTLRHAGNYGMGKRRLMQEIMSAARRFHINVFVSEWKAGQILEIFHKKAPKIRGVFHREIEEFVTANRYLVNPYGRFRAFYDRLDDSLIKEALANIPQSTVRDHVGHAMLRIKKQMPDIRFCMESHDAFCFISPENEWQDRAKECKRELERAIDFSRCSLPRGNLIIPAEIQVGRKNYREMEKVKL